MSTRPAATSSNAHAGAFQTSEEIFREIPADLPTSLMDKTVLTDVLRPAAHPSDHISTDSSEVCVRFGTAVVDGTDAASNAVTGSPTDLPVKPAINTDGSRTLVRGGEMIATQADADQVRKLDTPAGEQVVLAPFAIDPSTNSIPGWSRHNRPLGVRNGPAKALQTRLHSRPGISQSAEISLARNAVAWHASGSGPSTTIITPTGSDRGASLDPEFSVDEQDDFKHPTPMLDGRAFRTEARPGPPDVETPPEQLMAPIYSRTPANAAKRDDAPLKPDDSRRRDADSVSCLPLDETAARDTGTNTHLVATPPRSRAHSIHRR